MVKEGVNGAGGSERHFSIFEADEIWRRETETPIRAAYEYWLGCRSGGMLPRVSSIDDSRFGALGWRMRKVDVRPRYPGDFSVVATSGKDVFSLYRFSVIEGFHRDCMTLDLIECLDRRAALYIVADYLDGELQYQCREALFPVADNVGSIAWVYFVEVHDDEAVDTLRSDAARMAAQVA